MLASYDPLAPYFRYPWRRVKNGSGAIILPHSVVLASSTAIVDGEIVHTVIQPNAASTDFHFGDYLITWPIEIGAASTCEGMASTAELPCLARYDTGTPTIRQVFGPKHGQLTLSLNYYGYRILGAQTTSAGQNVVPVRAISSPIVIGKIDDTSVALGATCTVSVHVGTTYQTDSTMNITGVVNRGATLTGLSTPYCGVSFGNGIPVLMWVAC